MTRPKKLRKRYEVRQDKNGRWGIVDRIAVLVQDEFGIVDRIAVLVQDEFGIDDDAFAPWDAEEGQHDAHEFREIVDWAIRLNVGRTERDGFSWETWEPKP